MPDCLNVLGFGGFPYVTDVGRLIVLVRPSLDSHRLLRVDISILVLVNLIKYRSWPKKFAPREIAVIIAIHPLKPDWPTGSQLLKGRIHHLLFRSPEKLKAPPDEFQMKITDGIGPLKPAYGI